jgi:hypothetical protein
MTNIKIDREEQTAQEPSKRVGTGQDTRVPTHEGSDLGTPQTAGNTTTSMPSTAENEQ